MANALYGIGRASFLDADIDWSADNIRIILADSADYTLLINTDDFLNDVPGAARVATSGNLASKTSTLGTADAADVTFSAVSGDQSEYILIYQHTGTETTSHLIAAIDTATGLPVTPNGGDITVQWDNGTNKIFTL